MNGSENEIWVKEGFLWIRKSPGPKSGIVDVIHNTAGKIAHDKDTSDWAQVSYTVMGTLLVEGYRWPEKYGDHYGGRDRTDMTRDPYTAFGLCYAHLIGHMDQAALDAYFDRIEPPPLIARWWNHLKEDNREHYVIRLDSYKAEATLLVYQKKYDDNFYE